MFTVCLMLWMNPVFFFEDNFPKSKDEKEVFRRLVMSENLIADIINLNLEQEEQNLLESIENDDWMSIPNVKSEIQRFQEIAKQQVEMQKLELQISKQDSDRIYNLANRLGLSVTNFAQDIIHKYLQGELVEKN